MVRVYGECQQQSYLHIGESLEVWEGRKEGRKEEEEELLGGGVSAASKFSRDDGVRAGCTRA